MINVKLYKLLLYSAEVISVPWSIYTEADLNDIIR